MMASSAGSLLTGDGSHVQLPGQTLAGEDTLSIAGLVYLPQRAGSCFRPGAERVKSSVCGREPLGCEGVDRVWRCRSRRGLVWCGGGEPMAALCGRVRTGRA